jgi:hypothetical protein
MVVPRRLSLVTLSLVAAPWAILLGASGLWLLFSGPEAWPGSGHLRLIGGITLCTAGQLVCCVCIADRVFPRAGRALGWLVEIPLCIVLFGGSLWILWALLRALLAVPVG